LTRILVPSAAYILTDHALSSEGTTCYHLFQILDKFDYQFEAISAHISIKKPLNNVKVYQTGSFQVSPTVNPIIKYLSHTEFLTRSYLKSIEILQKQKINIIHHILPAVYNQTFSLLALSGKTKSYPFVFGPVSVHFYPRPPGERMLSKLTSKLHRETIRRCDRVITITNQVKKIYSNFMDEERITTIPLGVDTNLFRPQRETLNTGTHEILFAGYLYRLKGVEFLIKAVRAASEKRGDIKLRIVGTGPDKPDLARLVEALRIREKVIFEGFVPYTRMAEYYRQCDIFCFPTLGEPFGKAIIEAMACAKPVIASNVGGPAEIIQDGKTGVLVPPAQPKILALKILELLDDKNIMRKIGANARKAAIEKYSWEKIAEKYNKLYESLI